MGNERLQKDQQQQQQQQQLHHTVLEAFGISQREERRHAIGACAPCAGSSSKAIQISSAVPACTTTVEAEERTSVTFGSDETHHFVLKFPSTAFRGPEGVCMGELQLHSKTREAHVSLVGRPNSSGTGHVGCSRLDWLAWSLWSCTKATRGSALAQLRLHARARTRTIAHLAVGARHRRHAWQ